MIGQTILHYQIEEKIGSGGMGKVYKARDLKLDRPVVLKFPHVDMLQAPQIQQRLIREAKTSGSLNHPNIVTIYEINEWNNRLFICMEYVEGQTLAQICRAREIPLQEALDSATQITSAVNAAHKKGILHRDLKSSNIMLTADGLVKVLDFGLALGMSHERTFEQGEIELSSGDRLLLFTDGVTEVVNAEREEFGEERLVELLSSNLNLRAADVQKKIMEAVTEFSRGEFQDDVTMVVVGVE